MVTHICTIKCCVYRQCFIFMRWKLCEKKELFMIKSTYYHFLWFYINKSQFWFIKVVLMIIQLENHLQRSFGYECPLFFKKIWSFMHKVVWKGVASDCVKWRPNYNCLTECSSKITFDVNRLESWDAIGWTNLYCLLSHELLIQYILLGEMRIQCIMTLFSRIQR